LLESYSVSCRNYIVSVAIIVQCQLPDLYSVSCRNCIVCAVSIAEIVLCQLPDFVLIAHFTGFFYVPVFTIGLCHYRHYLHHRHYTSITCIKVHQRHTRQLHAHLSDESNCPVLMYQEQIAH
jgi:hypothetical protein